MQIFFKCLASLASKIGREEDMEIVLDPGILVPR